MKKCWQNWVFLEEEVAEEALGQVVGWEAELGFAVLEVLEDCWMSKSAETMSVAAAERAEAAIWQ